MSRELSLEESQEINKMMQQNKTRHSSADHKPQKPKKSAKRLAADEEVATAYRAMKKLLKLRSKSDLIEVLWANGVQMREFQEICKQLLEENASLKAILTDYDANVDYYESELAGSWKDIRKKSKEINNA